jgi:hypothetical protein
MRELRRRLEEAGAVTLLGGRALVRAFRPPFLLGEMLAGL